MDVARIDPKTNLPGRTGAKRRDRPADRGVIATKLKVQNSDAARSCG